MEMRKCENGHYYDASVNATCPYCTSAAGGATMPLEGGMGSDAGKTLPLSGMQEMGGSTLPLSGAQEMAGSTLPLTGSASMEFGSAAGASDDDGRTVALIKQSIGIDPVVGWLVCINGEEKGRDYRIHADNNFIGRSERMDICIRGDETISRENHAIVSYDTIDRIFFFSPGDGRSIIRYNGKALFQTTELKPYDHIVIGKTELIFIPFCTDKFNWLQEDND